MKKAPKRKPVKEVRAWALIYPNGKIDTAWIGPKRVQLLRAENHLRFRGRKCNVSLVRIILED